MLFVCPPRWLRVTFVGMLRTIVAVRLCLGRFRGDTGIDIFTERVVKRWHRLSREAAESPSLEVFKRLVDVVLRDMV